MNDEVEAILEKKQASLKDVLGAKDEVVEEKCMEIYRGKEKG